MLQCVSSMGSPPVGKNSYKMRGVAGAVNEVDKLSSIDEEEDDDDDDDDAYSKAAVVDTVVAAAASVNRPSRSNPDRLLERDCRIGTPRKKRSCLEDLPKV